MTFLPTVLFMLSTGEIKKEEITLSGSCIRHKMDFPLSFKRLGEN